MPQITRLFPLIDEVAVDQVLVTATYGVPSTVTLVTKSGKAVSAKQVWWATNRNIE